MYGRSQVRRVETKTTLGADGHAFAREWLSFIHPCKRPPLALQPLCPRGAGIPATSVRRPFLLWGCM